MEQKKSSFGTAIIIGISIVISCIALAFGLSHFRSESTHVISATGSASVDFEADIIIWRGEFASVAYTSQEAYTKIKKDAELVKNYLTSNGISESEVVFNSVDIGRTYKDNYDENGNYIGSEADGYRLTQSVTVSSGNLDNVEKVSRDISSLLDKGVELTSGSPEYYYSDLDALKLDLIDKASINAKDRIDIVARNSGAKLGKLKNSSLGVFQITAKNSGTGSYSYDGAFDTSSRHKTATITVRLEYDLK
ncbi:MULTISPECIES: SIMPL domain-containing protein [unclassified Butyrivibrio]|uniref:SIMPL domain-containing protein n=1 Tax=unclassified Butyrivibrio TaxID=2639466 RepID=UPI0003B79333|nr:MULTISPECIES: SIMPL domain-containing protein [unclassified Butyrivibrio]MDC7294211.1 SIMPL domain-containing protein [Butyrivibrio sp. DSM 10294]